MPPRPTRSTQAGTSNLSASSADPITPTPSPAPGTQSQREESRRTEESLTPPPASPRQAAIDRVSSEFEALRLPGPRLATAAEVERLNDIVAQLQARIGEGSPPPSRREERHATLERNTPLREASHAPTNYSSAPNKPKLKASDLPKFYGKDSEDVDQWIEKVSAIFEYSGVHDSDLLQQLPLVLQGNALTWFTQLGKERHALRTWHDWQLAIRNAFYMPNHRANLRRQCLYRTLRENESFGDYFSEKKRLQSYVFPASTPVHELIEDMIEGIPLPMQPLIKANVSRYTSLEEFRRILIDLEPGLRGRKMPNTISQTRPYSVSNYERAERKDGTTVVSQTHVVKPTFSPASNAHGSTSSGNLPRTNCFNCGGNHWRKDCPHPPKSREYSGNTANAKTYTTHSISETNRTPMNGNKWKQFSKTTNSIKTRSQVKATAPPVLTEAPISEAIPAPPPAVPETELSSEPTSSPPSSSLFRDSDEDAWRDKTPALALGEFEQPGGFSYPVCIDSGSSISIMDHDFALEYFPHITRNPCSSFELRGLGNTIVTESVTIVVHFRIRYTVKHIPIKVKFFLASNSTNVIMGNDVLVPRKANIDMHDGTLSFKGTAGQIHITCRMPGDLMHLPMARVKMVCTIAPRHMALVPIELEGHIPSETYYLEPDLEMLAPIMVARSVGWTNSLDNVAQVMNTTDAPVMLHPGQPLGTLYAIEERGTVKVRRGPVVNNIQPFRDDEKAFAAIIEEFNINPELSPEERRKMLEVLYENRRAFAYGSRKLGQTDLVKMTLDTGNAAPISSPPYHASPNGRKVIEKTIAELLSDNVIETSDSPWASPAILVHQKGKHRFCIDYRKINTVLKADQYPIPRVDDILTQFSGMAYYTTFDANKGFHQVEVDEKDREKTAFRTHVGLHQFKRMPFGLKTGPGVFQRLTDRILGHYKWQIALVYIDDIIIYSRTFQQHAQDVDTILKLVIKSGITLSPAKSYVAHHSIKALGHRVSNLGIGTLEETVRAVTEFPRPHNIKSLQRFLGLAVYYRKFVKNFARIAAPLYELLKKETEWKWEEKHQKAMEELKERLTTAPVLAHPDYNKPFIVHTDASTTGLGVVLSQKDADAKEHPIVYLSRTLSPAEKNYSSTEMECLAIIWALKKLHPYLDGSTFEIITDHSALQWILNFSGHNKRLLRWSMDLQPYKEHMIIKYRAGRVHQNADALSRAPLPVVNGMSHVSIEPDFFANIKAGYEHDSEARKLRELLNSDHPPPHLKAFTLTHDGLILFRSPSSSLDRVYVPDHENLRRDLLHDYHDAQLSAHLGYVKTLNNISQRYFWNNLARDVRTYCKTCPSCQRNKARANSGPTGMMQPLTMPPKRWHTVTMDFAGPFVASGEGDWNMVMIVVDKLTKRVHFVPAKNTDKAPDTATRFFDSVIRLHGMPRVIVSDRDAKFTSLFWRALMSRFGTRLAMSSAYHPQTDGQSEVMVRTLKEMLRHYLSHSQKDWTHLIPVLEFAYNNSVNASTGLTPFELDLGYHPVTPHTVDSDLDVAATESFIEQQQALLNSAFERLQKSQANQAEQYNKTRNSKEFAENDLVLLSTKHTHPPFLQSTGSKKLRSKYIGPFRITRKISPTAYELDLPAHIKIHPVVNVEYLKTFHQSPVEFGDRVAPRPEPILNEDLEPEYEVQEIRGHKFDKRGKLRLLCHWAGYEDHDDTFEPEENLSNAQEMLDAYKLKAELA